MPATSRSTAPPSGRACEVKGISFHNLVESFRALRGEEATTRALEAIPSDLREALRAGTLLASGWYPIASYRDLLGALVRASDEGPSFARKMAYESTLRDFRGIYRLLRFLLTPEAILRRAPVVHERYRRGGRMRLAALGDGTGEMVLEQCHGFDAACWQETLGATEAVLTVCGAKDVSLSVVEGGGDGDAKIRIVVRWTT